MKKLNKLHINSAKLMKNEELLTLKEGTVWVKCMYFGYVCGDGQLVGCELADEACDQLCGEERWDSHICVG